MSSRGRGGRGGFRGPGRGGGPRNWNQAQSDESQQQRRPPFMGYRKMKELESMDSNAMVLSLLSTRSGLRELLQANSVQPDWVGLLLGIFQKACTSSTYPHLLTELLNLIRASAFMEKVVVAYLTAMTTETSFQRQPLVDLLKLLQVMLIKMPNSFTNLMPVLINVEYAIRAMRKISTVEDSDIEQELERVVNMREELARRMRDRPKDDSGKEAEDIEPPDDFREKSIFPQQDDINDDKPFLRANRVKGQYQDVETYLDVQFRLLREDFVRPLREGIDEYLDTKNQGGRARRIQSLRVYHGVHVLNPVCTFTGTGYRIKFDASRLKRIRWEGSRRLIFGSLLCLSKDDFTTFLFATVTDRKPKDLEKGELEVRFEQREIDISALTVNDNFTMVETSAYFEAYRHVLRALQDTNENNFPFQQYIINCELGDDVMKPPAYLLHRGIVMYDLSTLCGEAASGTSEFSKVPVLNTLSWPRVEQLPFDASQLRAVQSALTKEFVVIQGPPGTGKTYIGLKTVEVLLRNKEYWHGTDDRNVKSPILIVCYTNHALDQFLEGIHTFLNEGIVRVGGRSSSSHLEQFMLKNLRAQVKKNRDTDRDIFQGIRDTRNEMTEHKTTIDEIVAQIEATSRGVIKEMYLVDVIEDHLYNSLQMAMFDRQSSSVLVDWLGLAGNIVFVSCGEAMVNENQDNEDEDEDSDEDIVIEDETAMRSLFQLDNEEYDITPVQREKIEKRMNRKRAEVALAVNLDTINKQQLDEGGWEVQNKKYRKKRMKQGLSSTDSMGANEISRVRDVWALQLPDRWRLYRHWINKYIQSLRDQISHLERRYDDAAGRLQEIKMQEDMHIMRSATIIGMTTTGAARYRAVLQEIKPKIVIVEEAAEVLEAHIVTTLSEGCQHLILIGDHKQLRPSANVYELAKKYNLEISLFERMVNNNAKYNCLELQHRMRPTIASLIEPIYPELKNDESVKLYEDIKGVSSNVFFIDHVQPESTNDELKSKSNTHEAQYIVALCRYLILQGYSPTQITVLTLYTGQLFKIRDNMKPMEFYNGTRLSAVDNFQGEENDIILLSLVRSNTEGSIGFLSIDNRVCVALSRAKRGLYVIGNFDLLKTSSKTPLWSKLVAMVQKNHLIGKELPLYCQNHQDTVINAKSPSDFMKAPEGGCTKPCEDRLSCGHACPKACHPDDLDHKSTKCMKPCDKNLCDDGHRCKKFCYEDCGKCDTLVERIVPRCGHKQKMMCHQSPFTFECCEPCVKTLAVCGHVCPRVCHHDDVDHKTIKCMKPCDKKLCDDGHRCKKLCYEDCGKCDTLVEKIVPRCGHKQKIMCHQSPFAFECREPCVKTLAACGHRCANTCGQECQLKCTKIVKWPCSHIVKTECYRMPEIFKCNHSCGETLKCDHQCSGTCGDCRQGRLHLPCKHNCGRTLVCGHSCSEPCTSNCPPCAKRCENRCTHSKCTMPCGTPCVPCKEPCDWECRHFKCRKLCSEPCDRPRCSRPCGKLLKCRHPCIGVCGENCPSLCRVCDKGKVTEIFFGTEDEEDALFVQLEDCKHIFEVSGLDTWMDAAVDTYSGNVDIQMKACPRCKATIRRNLRYGTILNKVLDDIERVKGRLVGEKREIENEKCRLQIEIDIAGGEDCFIFFNFRRALDGRLSVVSMETIAMVKNQLAFIKRINSTVTKIKKGLWKKPDDFNVAARMRGLRLGVNESDDESEAQQCANKLLRELDDLKEYIAKSRNNISTQELDDFDTELTRVSLLASFYTLRKRNHKTQSETAAHYLTEIDYILSDGRKLDTKSKEAVKENLKKIESRLGGVSDLGITDVERVQIVQAMGLSQGHWYKCPKGHVYAIGDCGGAIVESRCPECK